MRLFEQIFLWATHLPPSGLYIFIFLWLFVESTGFPISDEPVLLLAGYLTTTHKLALAPVILIALVGKVAASCVAFWIGHYFDLERLARPEVQPTSGAQRWLYYARPTKAFAIATEERFRRQGAWGVFLGRLIPIVRSFISYPAGAARMPFPIFLTATTAGSLLWITIWTVLGSVLGKSYEKAFHTWGRYSIFILLALIVVLAAAWVWNHRRAEAAAIRLQAQRVAEAARQARQHRKERHDGTTAKTPKQNATAKTRKK